MTVNTALSLEELEHCIWDEPEEVSPLVVKCHRLRKVPVSTLSVENIRMLIGQEIGLEFLVPVALDILASDPLAEGDMFKGDLLLSVAGIHTEFWTKHSRLKNELVEIRRELEDVSEIISKQLLPLLDSKQIR